MNRIPKEVVSRIGFNLDNKDEAHFLEKRYRKKSKKEIIKLIPKVIELKIDKTPIWKISFTTGLTISEVKKVLKGEYLKKEVQVSRGYILVSQVSSEFGDTILTKIQKKIFPYDNIRMKTKRGSHRTEINRQDIIVAMFFENNNIDIRKMDEWKELNSTQKIRMKYRLGKLRLGIDEYNNLIPIEKKDELKEVFRTIDEKKNRAGVVIE